MSDDTVRSGEGGDAEAPREADAGQARNDGLLRKAVSDVAPKILPVLLTAGGFLGFVAVAGGALEWARFSAAHIPTDDALRTLPQAALIAPGARVLAMFGIPGVFALFGLYLLDRGGRPTWPLVVGLFAVLGVEAGVAIALAAAHKPAGRVIPAALVAAAMLVLGFLLAYLAKQRRRQLAAIPSDEGKEQFRYELPWWGTASEGLLALAGIVGVCLLLGEWWVGVALGAAVALATANFAAAVATTAGFLWFGAVAFLSFPVFGTAAGVARAFAHPQVQPAALLVGAAGGPQHGVQGLFISETDSRVYLASLSTHCGASHALSGSGRLFWVPRKQVTALSLGPLQDINDAGKRAPILLRELVAAHPPTATASARHPRSRDSTPRPVTGSDVPAVKQIAQVKSVSPSPVHPGGTATVVATGIGSRAGSVAVGGMAAKVRAWGKQPNKIVFTVPQDAHSGRVTVACAGTVKPPVLRVRQPPAAVAVPEPTKTRGFYRFDGRGSRDVDGRIASYDWKVDGGSETVGIEPVIRRRLRRPVKRHRVVLTVTDRDGLKSTTTVRFSPRQTTFVIALDQLFCPTCSRLDESGATTVDALRRRVHTSASVRIDIYTKKLAGREQPSPVRARAQAFARALLRRQRRPERVAVRRAGPGHSPGFVEVTLRGHAS